MTTFLQRNAIELALGVVTGTVSGYGLHRLLPAPNGYVLVNLCVVNLCANIAIRSYVNESIYSYARKNGHVAPEGKITNPLYGRLGIFINLTSVILLPIFYRFVGHRLGYQVPSYLETMGCFNVSGTSFWFTRTTFEILRDAYFPKPERK